MIEIFLVNSAPKLLLLQKLFFFFLSLRGNCGWFSSIIIFINPHQIRFNNPRAFIRAQPLASLKMDILGYLYICGKPTQQMPST